MKDDRRALLFAVAAVALWSTVATAFKLSLRHTDVFTLLCYSSLTATLVLYGLLVVRGDAARPWQLARADYLRCAVLGAVNPFIYYIVLFKAYDLLPAQIAQSLNYSWGIMLVILSVPLLGHKVTPRDGIAVLICYAGAVLICLGGRSFPGAALSGAGVALALGSTVIWSLYWIGKTRDPLDPVISLFLSFLFSLPWVAAAAALFSHPLSVDRAGLLGSVYVGFFEMGFTYVLWLMAMRHATRAARVSTLIFLSPFLSLLLIHLVLAEPIALTTVAGLLCIAAGLLFQRTQASPV